MSARARHYRRQQREDPMSVFATFEEARADYNAAKDSRFRRKRRGIAGAGSGADYHYRNDRDFLRIMEVARDMARNDPIVAPAVERLVDNVVQDGFRLKATTGDDEADRIIDAEWKAFAEDPERCDLAGEQDFHKMLRGVCEQAVVDGDIFALPQQSGHLELLEANRCRTPSNTKRNVVHGILLDPRTRRRQEYWFTQDDVDPSSSVSTVKDMRKVAARGADGRRQVLQIYDPRRCTQTRGVSKFAPAIDISGMIDDIQFSKLVQQQVASCFAILRERSDDVVGALAPATGVVTVEDEGASTRTIQGVAPGLEVLGQPGEKLTGFSPNIPNAEYFEQLKSILRTLSINLGLPLNVLLLDPSDSNFSGWRGAMDQAKIGFRRAQRWLYASFVRRVWMWRVEQTMGEVRSLRSIAARLGPDIFRHDWAPPIWPYIEPLKDATADNLRLKSGMISPRRYHAERGRVHEEVIAEIVSDNALAIRTALAEAAAINGDFPEAGITWRDLAPLPHAEAMAPAAPAQEEEDDGQQQEGITDERNQQRGPAGAKLVTG